MSAASAHTNLWSSQLLLLVFLYQVCSLLLFGMCMFLIYQLETCIPCFLQNLSPHCSILFSRFCIQHGNVWLPHRHHILEVSTSLWFLVCSACQWTLLFWPDLGVDPVFLWNIGQSKSSNMKVQESLQFWRDNCNRSKANKRTAEGHNTHQISIVKHISFIKSFEISKLPFNEDKKKMKIRRPSRDNF